MRARDIATRVVATGIAVGLAVMATGCGILQKETPPIKRDWNAISSEGVMRVGTTGDDAPYAYHDDDGSLTGYEVELIEAVGKKLGLTVEFHEDGTSDLTVGLRADSFDVLANRVRITDELESEYLFSTPYAHTGDVIVTENDDEGISSFDDLEGRIVAFVMPDGHTGAEESYGAGVTPAKDLDSALKMVSKGDVDAAIIDGISFLDYKARHPESRLRVVATSDDIGSIAFMFRGNQGEFRDRVNDALMELDAEGFTFELSERYFGEDVAHDAHTDDEASAE